MFALTIATFRRAAKDRRAATGIGRDDGERRWGPKMHHTRAPNRSRLRSGSASCHLWVHRSATAPEACTQRESVVREVHT